MKKLAVGVIAAMMISAPAYATTDEADRSEAPQVLTTEDTLDESTDDEAPVGDTVDEEPVVEDETVVEDSEPGDETPTDPVDEGDPETEAPEDEIPNDDPSLGIEPLPSDKPENSAPVINGLTPITAISRNHVSLADLMAGVTVSDDQDNLVAEISGWGGWNDTVECPNGYPCTYSIYFTVTDSAGAFADGSRTVTITGQPKPTPTPSPEPRPERPAPAPQPSGDATPIEVEQPEETDDELANTGARSNGLLLAALTMLGMGSALTSASRKARTR